MKKVIKIVFIVLLTLVTSCERRYTCEKLDANGTEMYTFYSKAPGSDAKFNCQRQCESPFVPGTCNFSWGWSTKP